MDGENSRSLRGEAFAEGGENAGSDESKDHDYCLFISGRSARTQQSIKVIRAVCDKYIGKGYNFVIVNVFDNPERAELEKIFLTPTLVRYRPPPSRRIVGDFSSEAVLAASMDFID